MPTIPCVSRRQIASTWRNISRRVFISGFLGAALHYLRNQRNSAIQPFLRAHCQSASVQCAVCSVQCAVRLGFRAYSSGAVKQQSTYIYRHITASGISQPCASRQSSTPLTLEREAISFYLAPTPFNKPFQGANLGFSGT